MSYRQLLLVCLKMLFADAKLKVLQRGHGAKDLFLFQVKSCGLEDFADAHLLEHTLAFVQAASA
jgi:hypothetical protein